MNKFALRRHMLAGLTALLPTLLTLFVFYKLWQYASDTIGEPMVNKIVKLAGWKEAPAWMTVSGGVVGLLIVVLVIFAAGVLLSSLIGARLFSVAEGWLARVPVISAVYNPVRQVTDFFLSKKSQLFRSAVAVEYPRKGMYSIGFVTSSGFKDVTTPDGRRMIGVFVPTSPTPFTGYTFLVPESDVIPLDIPIDDAIKYFVSGGVIRPPSQVPPSEQGTPDTLAAGPAAKVEISQDAASSPQSDT